MKKICTVLIVALASNGVAQQTQKKFTGPFSIGNNEGTATYTYFEQNGERVIDGNFSYNCPTENITITGKYAKGKKTGVWTRKQLYSRYNGMAVVKADLKWPKVTANTPFKEITEVTTENYLNDKLEGVWTQTKTVKNSWGYPAPGGTSSFDFIVKKTFVANEMTSIEGTRKKNGISNLSLKGSYKNKLADGNWLFNDNKNIYSYNFTNGYLSNYEIKEVGTGKVIAGNKIEIDNELINSYFTKSENNFEIEYGQFYSELKDAKISIQKVNENLSITKICILKKEAANFVNLDVQFFSNIFGEDVTPYKNYDYNEFAYSPTISCEVLNENNYGVLDKVYFKEVKSEFAFLNLTTKSKGQFLNTDWEKINNFYNSRYFFQLKSYLYKGDTTGLRAFLQVSKNFNLNFTNEPIPNGKYVNIGSSENEFSEYLKFITAVSLGENNTWQKLIDDNFNKNSNGQKWQYFILNQLDTLINSTSFRCNKEAVSNYINLKEKEIEMYNMKSLENIKSINIGNQAWMSEDLIIIPKNIDFIFYPQDTINALSKVYRRFPDFREYGDKVSFKGNNYEIRISEINKSIFVSSKKINKNISPEYYMSDEVLKICPKGWRLPTDKDFEVLNSTLGGDASATNRLLSKGGGSGFDSSELNYIYLNTKDNKLWRFFGFGSVYRNHEASYKSYGKCRCIKE